MKKISILGLCLAAAFSMTAQINVVKEADREFKKVKNYGEYQKALQMITPAFTNPETDKDAQTFYIPGKAGFKLYDDMYGLKQFGQDVNLVEMSNALMDGYDYSMKALARDTVVVIDKKTGEPKLNKNGEVETKTKYSKDIVSQICGHFADFSNAGSIFWGEKDFNKAYDAFTVYLSIPGNPVFGKDAPKQLPDSTAAEFEMYRAYAAMNANKLPQALDAFDSMVALGGVPDTVAYDFAFNAAYQSEKDYPRMLKYTQQAYEKFGDSQPRFLELLVNIHIDQKDYDTAKQLLNGAIAKDPNNAGYYFSLGFLSQSMNDMPAAKAAFKKATELDPKHARALLAYASLLATEFDALDSDASSKMSQAEYNKYFVETLKPMLLEIAQYCEASYAADEEMTDALRTLRQVYYRLNDAENLKRVETLLL